VSLSHSRLPVSICFMYVSTGVCTAKYVFAYRAFLYSASTVNQKPCTIVAGTQATVQSNASRSIGTVNTKEFVVANVRKCVRAVEVVLFLMITSSRELLPVRLTQHARLWHKRHYCAACHDIFIQLPVGV
jgi:hypothetical protein